MKPRSVDGLEVCVLNKDMIRIYDDKYPEGFIDCTLAHTDLNVVIQDSDAYLYNHNGEYIIDHSPETLGYKNDSST